MSTTETTPTATCPECGGVLEATTKVYWSYVDGRWVVADAGCSDEELAEAARDFLDSGGDEPWGAFDSWVRRIAKVAYMTHLRWSDLRQAGTP